MASVVLACSLVARPSAAAYCAIHPIYPPCCPSPCPVFDGLKVGKFMGEAEAAWQKIGQGLAVTQHYLTLLNSIGPQGPLTGELRPLASVAATLGTGPMVLPSSLQPDDLANPGRVAEVLKASLFDPGLAGSSLTAGVLQSERRADMAAGEAAYSLATTLHAYARLVDVATDGGQRAGAAVQAGNLRDDLAANISARQAVVDNIGGIKELIASWAAGQAAMSTLTSAVTLGALPTSGVTSAPSSPTSVDAATARLEALQQTRMSIEEIDLTISALTALHNDRYAAKAIQAQYAGLRNTVESEQRASLFRDDGAAKAGRLLGEIFADGPAAFGVVQQRLLALDGTGWRDSGLKDQAAAAAAASVVEAIAADPGAFGSLQNSQPSDRAAAYAGALHAALREAFAAWLEDDKLERFWRPLRDDAELAIQNLDRRLADINRRCGLDITGPAAVEQEARLLDRFHGQLRRLSSLNSDGPEVEQAAVVAAVSTAFQQSATAVAADREATRLVTVDWPR